MRSPLFSMKTEPTAIVEVIRLVAIVAGLFGVVITAEEQAAIVGGIGAAIVAASAILAIWNRRSVFSQKTTEKLVVQAAATGNVPAELKPPDGT